MLTMDRDLGIRVSPDADIGEQRQHPCDGQVMVAEPFAEQDSARCGSPKLLNRTGGRMILSIRL